jgi:opacity protein-like surface antigen
MDGMNMKIKLAAVCLLASSSVFAQDTKVIAGINYTTSISADATATLENTDDEITEDIDMSALGLYLGYISESNNRFLVTYSTETVDFDASNGSEDITGFDFDWQFVYGEDQVQPYLGFGLGLHTIDEALILNNSNQEGESLSGVSAQLMAGIKLAINETVELDVSFKRKAYVWESIEVSAGFFSDTLDTSYVTNSLSFGAGFKF